MSLRIEQQRFSLVPISTVVAVSIGIMALLQALPVPWQHLVRYDRAAVLGGGWYRLVSGHFIHLGWSHFALNIAGLVLGTWLFGADRSPRWWLGATAASALACGLGLLLWSPEVRWCVGLSGVLHGLMVVGFGGWALAGDRWALVLLAVVVGKMSWEQFGGSMPWEAAMAGGRVVTDAHVWGAVGGAAWLAGDTALRLARRRV